MKILSATVDKRPEVCSACPLCAIVRSRAPCGELKTIRKDYGYQTIKVPNNKCLLKERVR